MSDIWDFFIFLFRSSGCLTETIKTPDSFLMFIIQSFMAACDAQFINMDSADMLLEKSEGKTDWLIH